MKKMVSRLETTIARRRKRKAANVVLLFAVEEGGR